MQIDPLQLLLSALDLTLFTVLREEFAEQPGTLLVINILVILTLATIPLLLVFVVGWVERKVLARMQDRIGPNRVGGRYGLLQMVADVVKMMTKEVIIPAGADLWAYLPAPVLALMTSVLLFAVMPLAPAIIGVDLNVALFYVLSISSVSVVALLLAGWGSNNKYALLGAFRAVAQLVSYEVPMILALLVPILLARSMSTVGIVAAQNIPFIIFAPIAALVFFVSSLAETGRTPFDLLEAESEIVAGYHTEYTGMYFGLFQAGEYIAVMFMCALFSTVFLGGYRFFGLEDTMTTLFGQPFFIGNVIGAAALFVKSAVIFFIFMWLRGTLPRFRIDQLLNFNWKFMVPLTIVLLFTVAVLDKLIFIWFPNISDWGRAIIHLASNLLIAAVTIELVRGRIRRQRRALEPVEAEPVVEMEHAHAH
jgi:NADH-quinone oxidoreductase subunit H